MDDIYYKKYIKYKTKYLQLKKIVGSGIKKCKCNKYNSGNNNNCSNCGHGKIFHECKICHCTSYNKNVKDNFCSNLRCHHNKNKHICNFGIGINKKK